MLDMGFVHDVRKVIAKLPTKRQTLLFSATMPPEITALSSQILINPVRVEVTPPATTAEKIQQSVYFVEKAEKRKLLVHLLEEDPTIARAIVFTRTKHGANRVAEILEKSGIEAAAIHGNKSQGARERALGRFRDGTLRVLVATDIAARGIDVDGVTHVINFDLPNVPEQYVHRIGRTARAGAEGLAFSFCEEEERPYLVDIERITAQHVPVITGHPFASHLPVPAPTNLTPAKRTSGGSRPQAPRGEGRSGNRAPRNEARAPRPESSGREGARPARHQKPKGPRGIPQHPAALGDYLVSEPSAGRSKPQPSAPRNDGRPGGSGRRRGRGGSGARTNTPRRTD